MAPSRNVKLLREHGPLPAPVLPYGINLSDKIRGVWKFDTRSNANGGGGAERTGGQITPIYYLEDEHDREEVVRAFYLANQSYFEAKSRQAITQDLNGNGRQWREAIQDVLREVYDGDE